LEPTAEEKHRCVSTNLEIVKSIPDPELVYNGIRKYKKNELLMWLNRWIPGPKILHADKLEESNSSEVTQSKDENMSYRPLPLVLNATPENHWSKKAIVKGKTELTEKELGDFLDFAQGTYTLARAGDTSPELYDFQISST
jgi:hypothetical protein